MRKQAVLASVALAAAFAAAGGFITAPIARAAPPVAKPDSQLINKTQDTFTTEGVTCTFSYGAHVWHCHRAYAGAATSIAQ